MTASLHKRLAETGQQRLRAAGHCLGQRDHLLQLGSHNPLALLRRRRLRQPVPSLRHVLAAEQQQRIGRLAIAPGAPDLLVVGLRAVGHVQMHHETNVRAVDAHAEGDGCNHNHWLPGPETRSTNPLSLWIEAGMERPRPDIPSPTVWPQPARFSLCCRNRRCRIRLDGPAEMPKAARVSPTLGAAARRRLGRWKLETNTSASRIRRAVRMSLRVRGSAVAVSAMRGTPGNRSATRASSRNSGRNSWPHCETQCASSIANKASRRRDSRSQRAVVQQPLR